MFYTIVSKIPFIQGKNNFLIIFILGSLAYIFLHYYLWSKQQPDFLDKGKSYLYYLMFIDLAIAYFLSRTSVNEKDSEKDNPYTPEEKKEVENDLLELKKSRQQESESYKQNLLELQQLQQAQQQAQQYAQQQYLQQQYQLHLAAQQNKNQEIQNSLNNCENKKQKEIQINENDDDNQSGTGSNQSPFKTIDEVNEDKKKSDESKRKKNDTTSSSSNSNSSNNESNNKSNNKTKKVLNKKKEHHKKETEDEIDEDTNIPIYKGK